MLETFKLFSQVFVLFFCSGSSIYAQYATIRVSGSDEKITYRAGKASNHLTQRIIPFEPLSWMQEKAPYEYGSDVPLRPNVPQEVSVEFTPLKTGRVQISLMGYYRKNSDGSQQVLTNYWNQIEISNALPCDDFPASGLNGWKLYGSPENITKGDFGRVTSPDWFQSSVTESTALAYWHYAHGIRCFQVVAGQPVTIHATVGYEDRETDFSAIYRTAEYDHLQKITLTDGRTLIGAITDRNSDTLFIETSERTIAIPLDSIAQMPTWRSELYPEDWVPGYRVETDTFLHDFSYAGYRQGTTPIPQLEVPLIDVTDAPYHADPSGKTDCLTAIQQALDDAGEQGGGIVYLPAGTYLLAPPPSPRDSNIKLSLLTIRHSNVILRGAGSDKTFLFNNSYQMHRTSIIAVRGSETEWEKPQSKVVTITEDLSTGITEIPVSATSTFSIGDTVIIQETMTDARLDELDMHNYWITWGKRDPQTHRTITAIDPTTQIVSIDIPTRQPVRIRDNAQLYRIKPMLSEVGLENFSIGNREHPEAYIKGVSPRGLALADTEDQRDWLNEDGTRIVEGSKYDSPSYNSPDSFLADVHDTYLITLHHVSNSWIRDVDSYRPKSNTRDMHMLSNGFILNNSRNITVVNCDLANPLFVGGGGNGYLISLGGSDNLIRNCTLTRARHPFSSRGPQTSGNVLHNIRLVDGGSADWHMQLSPANLADNIVCDGSMMEAWSYRGNGSFAQHGHTTTETVFWNTRGIRYPHHISYDRSNDFIIDSNQYGRGYIIGTRGPAPEVRVDAPALFGLFGHDETPEWVEGIGHGATLEPQSLYFDQLQRRLKQSDSSSTSK